MAADLAGRAPVLLDDVAAIRAFCRDHLGADPGEGGVTFLSGGVSSIVAEADLGADRVVVKQALPELRVAAPWASRTERALIEAAAAEALDRVVPGAVPRIRVVVPERHAFAMDRAPLTAETWKDRLMRGEARPADATRAGTLLGRIHSRSTADAALARQFGDRSFFDELRVDPYLRVTAAAHPDLAPAISELVLGVEAPGSCLVHGDFSPKNLLVTPDDGMLLIDHEVAHWGVPAFDVAFVLTHLCLKAVRFGTGAVRNLGLAKSLLAAYRAVDGTDPAATGPFAGRLLGAIMLARIDGKSPVEYLPEPELRDLVRGVARRALLEPVASPETVIDTVASAVAGS